MSYDDANFGMEADDEGKSLARKTANFFRYSVPPIAFMLFYIVVMTKNVYPLMLSWEENRNLIAYSNEVLIYEGTHQWGKDVSFYNQRYAKEAPISAYSPQAIGKRNADRERDLEILKIGLKLYRRSHSYDFPVATNVESIGPNTNITERLREVLYNIPEDPDPTLQHSYGYSSDGYSYTLTMDFESIDDMGRIAYISRTYSYPE